MNKKQGMIKLAERLAENLSLNNIHLIEATFSRAIDKPIPDESNISINATTGVLKSDNKQLLPFHVQFTIRAVESKADRIVFQISPKFCLIYQIKEGFDPNQEELKAFGITNVVFNAWPYAREFVQNSMARMDLPPFVMKPLRISDLIKSADNMKSTENNPQIP